MRRLNFLSLSILTRLSPKLFWALSVIRYVAFVLPLDKLCAPWESGNIDLTRSVMSSERDIGKSCSAKKQAHRSSASVTLSRSDVDAAGFWTKNDFMEEVLHSSKFFTCLSDFACWLREPFPIHLTFMVFRNYLKNQHNTVHSLQSELSGLHHSPIKVFFNLCKQFHLPPFPTHSQIIACYLAF